MFLVCLFEWRFKSFQHISGYLMTFPVLLVDQDLRRICGLGVERSLLDPKVVGSNPGGAEIGLHDFHDPQKWARILVQ